MMPLLSSTPLLLAVLSVHLFNDGGGNMAQALAFGVIGDWALGGYATGWNAEIVSTRRYAEVCRRLGCNFTISVGDNFYCSDLGYCILHSFEEDMVNVSGPFFPCAGNHDNVGGQMNYAKRNPRWYWPSRYYTVKLPIDNTGYTVQLFAVDTLDKSLRGGRQLNWLTDELRKSNARWKIIFGHHPTAGSGRHRRVQTVNQIHRLMNEFNAQVYFSGHDHIVEVNNMEGRVLAISGGMARGAMMAHGIGGASRRFTLTNPSEYSPYVQPWASHGFLTVDLAPNTMNMNVWDSSGGMQYEFVMTHNWMSQVINLSLSARNMWPPPDVVLQAMKDELTLPLGPGDGTAFLADGTRVTPPENMTTNAATQSPSNATTQSPSNATTQSPSNATTQSPSNTTAPLTMPVASSERIPNYIRYAVMAECDVCDGMPRVGKRFTLHLNGVTVGSAHRLYLTNLPEGCDDVGEERRLLPGTRIESLQRNTLQFNVSREEKSVFLCFSIDSGSSYGRILREDTLERSYEFSITVA